MNILHIFHVFADGQWKDAVTEHFAALDESGLAGQLGAMGIGMVGSMENRVAVREYIATEILPSAGPALQSLAERGDLQNLTLASADEGWEQVTMQCLPSMATQMVADKLLQGDACILYAHTKGAWDASEINIWWRRSMTHDVINRWRECVTMLRQGYDAAGPHIIPPQHGGPFFGGNFWWATADYITRLPALSWETRHNAENWIGLGGGKLFDVRPGWPGFGSFAPEVMALREAME